MAGKAAVAESLAVYGTAPAFRQAAASPAVGRGTQAAGAEQDHGESGSKRRSPVGPACQVAVASIDERIERRRASHQVMIAGPSSPNALGAQNFGLVSPWPVVGPRRAGENCVWVARATFGTSLVCESPWFSRMRESS
jgi:hypothetical protein